MSACVCTPANRIPSAGVRGSGGLQRTAPRYCAASYPGLIGFSTCTAYLGTDQPCIPGDREGPYRTITLNEYALAATAVTVDQFSAFIAQTGYVTDAERTGWSMVFEQQVPEDAKTVGSVVGTPWWQGVLGACWRTPTGISDAVAAGPIPVVHVSWRDAMAYCQWAGGRLPNEAEWEHAARGGQGDVLYSWGNAEPFAGDHTRCNIWRGDFPRASENRPQPMDVYSFDANKTGFYNMCGNVWEWTADAFDNGFGPDSFRRTLKGGSYLCHESYCYRYRIAARICASEESTTSHQGFRIAFDIKA